MQRVLVTGCSGRIGSAVCQAFLQCEGVSVRGFDAFECPRPLTEHPGFEFVQGRLQDHADLVSTLDGTDAVIHLAACPDDADWDSVLLPANIQGTVALLRAIEAHNKRNTESRVKRLILASSGKLFAGYDHQGRAPEGGFPIGSHHPPRPVCAYGATKGFAEAAAMAFSSDCDTGCETAALRFAWCPRSADDVEAMRRALADGAPDEFLAPADAAACVVAASTCAWPSDQWWFASAFVQSLPIAGRVPRFDVSAAQKLFQWQGPEKQFPDNIDEIVIDRTHASDDLLRPRDDPHPGVWR